MVSPETTDPSGLIHLRARYYAPGDGRFISRDTWDGDYNRPLSLNRWNYVEGNPVKFTDPSGYLTKYEIMDGFNLSTVDEVAKLFRPGGRLSGKWGYLAFLDQTSLGEWGRMWKVTSRTINTHQGGNPDIFWRPDLSASPCPNPSIWVNGCYHEGILVSRGKFLSSKDGIVWDDFDTGLQYNLMALGLFDVDWYFPDSSDPQGFYAYEWYPVKVGYDWNKVDKLPQSSNLAGLLSPCVFACPEVVPVCVVGLFATIWDVVGGTISWVADGNKVSAGDLDSIGNLGVDGCSSFPIIGWGCSWAGFWSGFESGNVYLQH